MFPRILKWIGFVMGGLITLVVVLVGTLYVQGNARLAKTYDVQPDLISIPTDAKSLDRGEKWAAVLCADCHGADFSGQPLMDDKVMGFIPAPNLTSGKGGVGGEFADADWVLVLRSGIDPQDGRAYLGMPSMNFFYLTDEDLGSLIAYMKTVPPVDHELGDAQLSFMGKVMLAAGGFGKHILPAEIIIHGGPRPAPVTPGASVEYGRYLVQVSGCRDCHGEDLTGGKSPEPGAPFAPDITSTGIADVWTQESFIVTVRNTRGTGMPWEVLRPLTDEELQAIFLYLQSLALD